MNRNVTSDSPKLPETAPALPQPESQMNDQNSHVEPMEVDEEHLEPAVPTNPKIEKDSANPPLDVNLPNNHPPVVNLAVEQLAKDRAEDKQAQVADSSEDTDDEDETMDEGEDEGEEDRVSSGVPEIADFQKELQDVLRDSSFSFTGTFYHAGLLNSPSSPCLDISGLGIIGQPLSDHDVGRIISCATPAPLGQGDHTAIDKDVRDTWEIEPSKVSFRNANWDKYVKDVAYVEACKSLGVDLGKVRPRMELNKLLLYGKGSHFLPQQDTEKVDDIFATVTILLPSAYTGGQVILSHSSTKKEIDFSQESLFSFALLAWYTDVKHEIKEVTSGYRLALVYNLIHVATPGVPQPCLPDMSDSQSLLRRVLEKWRDGVYKETFYPELRLPERKIVVYVLEHQYSLANLKEGAKSLKGVDAHKVAYIRPIAEDLGFSVGLASLKHRVIPPSYSDYDSDEWRYGGPDTEVNTTIKNVVDLCGSTLIPAKKLDICDVHVVPKALFDDDTPDNSEDEDCMENRDHSFDRTVLVLVRPNCIDDICYKAGGVAYAYSRLKMSSTVPPTDIDRLWATRVLEKRPSLSKKYVLGLIKYALKWKDADMWNGIMKCSESTLENIDNKLLMKAWKVFSFAGVCSSFSELVNRSKDMKERMNFIYKLPSQSKKEEHQSVRAWRLKESDKIISSYNSFNVEDIMFIIRTAGIQAFSRLMVQKLLRGGGYTFVLSLRKALIQGRQSILAPQAKALSSSTADAATESVGVSGCETKRDYNSRLLLDDIIKRCLEAAALQWSNVVEYNGYPHHHYGRQYAAQPSVKTAQIDRIVDIIEQATNSHNMDIIRKLFMSMVEAPGKTATKFTQLYIPFIPRLKAVLVKISLDLYSPPFRDLLQIFIGFYLRDVLGSKDQVFDAGLRKIGCGCEDCQSLDKFIMDLDLTRMDFPMHQKRRTHLENRLNSAQDLCTYGTFIEGIPHTLRVTKLPSVIAASTWSHRERDARTFLASIGSDSEISRIMGSSYPDVLVALQGTQPFSAVQTVIEVPATTNCVRTIASDNTSPVAFSHEAVETPLPPSSSSAIPVAAHPDPPRLAGMKRKAAVQLGPDIDINEEENY